MKLREDVERTKESVQKHHSRFKKEIENDSTVNLKVPPKLTKPDTPIAAAQNMLYKKEVYSKTQGIICHNQGSIEIYESPGRVSRARRFCKPSGSVLRW